MISTIISLLKLKPKNIFLIDSIGALITAFSLFAILRPFHEYIGFPESTLTYLALAAAIFCMYSALCYSFLKNHWRPFLLLISLANISYCLVTIALIIFHFQSLTFIGLTYFIAEIAVVGLLVFIELKFHNHYRNK